MAEADPRVAAARREVLAARAELVEAVGGLETSARSSLDLKVQVQKSPERAAAAATGLAFLALGGPKKVLGGAKRAIFGKGKPYPSKMLPEEVDKVVRGLGSDGEKVRGVLEREFASYLKTTKKSDKRFWRDAIVGSLIVPAANAALREGVKRAVAATEPPRGETPSDGAGTDGKSGKPGKNGKKRGKG